MSYVSHEVLAKPKVLTGHHLQLHNIFVQHTSTYLFNPELTRQAKHFCVELFDFLDSNTCLKQELFEEFVMNQPLLYSKFYMLIRHVYRRRQPCVVANSPMYCNQQMLLLQESNGMTKTEHFSIKYCMYVITTSQLIYKLNVYNVLQVLVTSELEN